MRCIFADILFGLFLTACADAVTLIGSADYALPGSDFTLTCDVPEEAQSVTFYRRPDLTNEVGSIQVGGDRQCYNTKLKPPVVCDPDVCSCVPTSTGGSGTVFRWVIQPWSGDQGSVWFCRRTNLDLPSPSQDSLDFTLNVADVPSITQPTVTTYTRTEGDTLPNITCTADCRPGCTLVWTKPDNTNFTVSPVLSLGQLDRSEHGTYRCTARNGIGESTITINVTVQYGPGTSTALSPPGTIYTTTEGDMLPDITCTADCRPGCTFVWTKPDNTNFTASAVLSLGQLDRSEHGTYKCTARNVVGESTRSITVTVRFPPKILNLSYTQGGADVIEEGSKSLFCSVESYPPSTIQWYFKGNNSILLTTVNVLESTYTLTTAGCLDTGMYTCSVRNDVSSIAVTRDLHINVLCKPRPDPRVNHKYKFGLAASETLNIFAVFLCNPEPTYTWTFQTTPETSESVLANGTDSFAIHNSFSQLNLSSVSIGKRTNMQESWFGLYNVTATNRVGSRMISFQAEAKGKPNRPYNGTAVCGVDWAVLTWRSAFNGGATQTFGVGKRSSQQDNFVIDSRINRTDPGNGGIVNTSLVGLEASTQHFFMVYAVNEFGNSTFEEEINCTTKDKPSPVDPSSAALIGGVGGSAAAIVIVIGIIVAILVKRRTSGKSKGDDTEMMNSGRRSDHADGSDGMKPNILYESSSDGLKPNVLYESAGPQPGSSSEYAVVQKPKTKTESAAAIYTEVDKSKDVKPETEKNMYAEVSKPPKKVKKAHKKEDPTSKMIYANCANESQSVSDKEPSRKKNKDGLIYLDVEFKDKGMSGRDCIINGIDNKVLYTDIDFTRHADNPQFENENNQSRDTPKEEEKAAMDLAPQDP